MAKAKSPTPKKKKQPTFARASDMINATNLAEDQVVDWFRVAIEQWMEGPEFEKLKKAETKAAFTKALKTAFATGWAAFDKQPKCNCGRPERGGERQGSALCHECYFRDDIYPFC